MRVKVTHWYSGDVYPYRPGVYQRMLPTGIVYAKYADRKWYVAYCSVASANAAEVYSPYNKAPWRGLKEQTWL